MSKNSSAGLGNPFGDGSSSCDSDASVSSQRRKRKLRYRSRSVSASGKVEMTSFAVDEPSTDKAAPKEHKEKHLDLVVQNDPEHEFPIVGLKTTVTQRFFPRCVSSGLRSEWYGLSLYLLLLEKSSRTFSAAMDWQACSFHPMHLLMNVLHQALSNRFGRKSTAYQESHAGKRVVASLLQEDNAVYLNALLSYAASVNQMRGDSKNKVDFLMPLLESQRFRQHIQLAPARSFQGKGKAVYGVLHCLVPLHWYLVRRATHPKEIYTRDMVEKSMPTFFSQTYGASRAATLCSREYAQAILESGNVSLNEGSQLQ